MTRQTFIPGTAPPRNRDIDHAIEAWYEARAEQRLAAEKTSVRHATLLERMTEAEIERYPFDEPETGKRKILVAAAIRRARTAKAPSAKQEAADAEFERGAREAGAPGSVAAVAAGQAAPAPVADPFASTRGAMAPSRRSSGGGNGKAK